MEQHQNRQKGEKPKLKIEEMRISAQSVNAIRISTNSLSNSSSQLVLSLSVCSSQVRVLRWKSGTSSRRWVARQKDDYHSKLSKSEGYRSRAAYKLIEIDNKFKIFNGKSRNIVDLGFAPGAWTQVALNRCKAKKVRPNILGVDLLGCLPPEGAHFLQGDIFSKKTHEAITEHFGTSSKDFGATIEDGGNGEVEEKKNGNEIDVDKSVKDNGISAKFPLDLVLSDMMVNTSGIKDNDHFASMDLCDGVLILASRLLRKDGNLVVKFYTGKEDQFLQRKLERLFVKVHKMKPEACRAELREMYFVGLRKRTNEVDLELPLKRE